MIRPAFYRSYRSHLSHVAKFMERHAKAKDPNNPFPADRVFPSVQAQFDFGDELREMLSDLNEYIERLERQIRGLNI